MACIMFRTDSAHVTTLPSSPLKSRVSSSRSEASLNSLFSRLANKRRLQPTPDPLETEHEAQEYVLILYTRSELTSLTYLIPTLPVPTLFYTNTFNLLTNGIRETYLYFESLSFTFSGKQPLKLNLQPLLDPQQDPSHGSPLACSDPDLDLDPAGRD